MTSSEQGNPPKKIIERNFLISALGFSERFLIKNDVIKFISKKDLAACQKGTFLVGSIDRNKKFDNARKDTGELCLEVWYKNPKNEEWSLHGDDCMRYACMAATEEITTIKGNAGLCLIQPVANGNPYSLSLSYIEKSLDNIERKNRIEQIRKNIEYDADDIVLRFKKPRDLIFQITELLIKKCNVQLMTVGSEIIYRSREVSFDCFTKYKQYVDQTYHSRNLNFYPIFIKPEVYKLDSEYRIIWFAHSGGFNRYELPAWLNYQNNTHIILDGINFDDHFEVIE
jgi:hypothetical protein